MIGIGFSKAEKQILKEIRNSRYSHKVKKNNYLPMKKLIYEGLFECLESEYGHLLIPSLTNPLPDFFNSANRFSYLLTMKFQY